LNTIKKNNLGTHRNIKNNNEITARKMIYADTNVVDKLLDFNLKTAVDKY
jgi:hypothetical protein